MSEETGKRIGDYEILGVLGRGGMGKVFKVRNVISDRIEAMKILLPDLAGRQDLADRFLREIKVLASLNHPNIASLQTALTLDNQLVMVMEYVEGITLGERLEQGAISAADAVNYTEQVLAALSYAHKRNVIHRDIKPANMMITPDGVVKLMDFGIARSGGDRGLTATGTTIGSLYYMSPEQVKGQTTDARSDLYSLGVSLYEMVTGQRPFQADSDYSIMAAQVQATPKPPIELRSDLPPALNEIIVTAIAKDPAQRFQSADAFRNALGSLRGTLQGSVAANQNALPIVPPLPAVAGATAMMQDAAVPTASSAMPLPPPVQAEAVPSVLELSAKQKSHRGLYMSLGALIVLVMLVVAGIYVPRRATTRASEPSKGTNDSSTASTSSSGTADADKSKAPDADTGKATDTTMADTNAQGSANKPAQDTSQPVGAKADGSIPGMGAAAGSKMASQTEQIPSPDPSRGTKKHARNLESKIVSPGGATEQDAAGQGSVAARPDAAQLETLGEQADQLSSRVNALNDSLDHLRSQQSASGYGLRSDISSAQEMMKMHLSKAQSALQNQDAAGAKKYLDLAEGDAAKIDKFLGH